MWTLHLTQNMWKLLKLLPPGWDVRDGMLFPPSIKFAGTHLYSWVDKFPGLKFTFTLSLPRSRLILLTVCRTFHISYLSLTDFQNFSGPVAFFQELSSPGKCHNKIPGLSRFSRTRTNPVKCLAQRHKLRPLFPS